MEETIKNPFPETIEEIYREHMNEVNQQLFLDGTSQLPTTVWSFSYDAADMLTVYAALRTYLKVLSQQPEEDLEMIARVVRLMAEMKPRAVVASQTLAEIGNNAT